MPGPDVRVRLTAEGVAEVVAALKQIERESAQTAGKTSRSFGLLNGTLGKFKGLLGGIAAALSVRAFAGFLGSARSVADQVQNAAERIGTTTERLSALNAVAVKSDADIGQLQFSLGQFAKRLVALRAGAPEVAEVFRRLGLGARDFNGKDTAEAVGLVAERMAPLRASAEKTAIALALFGKSGATIIPALNELGQRGLPATIAAARELGLVLDDDVGQAADALGDDFDHLKLQAQILAAQFLTGLTPDLRRGIDAISGDLEKSGKNFRAWGEDVGAALRGAALIFGTLADVVITVFDVVGTAIGTFAFQVVQVFKVAGALIHGDLGKARKEWEAELAGLTGQEKGVAARLEGRLARLRARLAAVTNPAALPPGSPGGTEPAAGAEDDGARARAEAQRAAIDAEVSLLRARNKLRAEADQQSADEGLISTAEYFARRRSMALAETAAEIAAIARQRALLSAEADPERRAQEQAKLDAAAAQARIAGEQAVLQLNQEELRAVRELGTDRAKLEQKIFEAEGRRYEAATAAIAEQLRDADLLLAKQGVSPGERAAQVARLGQALRANAEFERVRGEAEGALQDLATSRAAIEAQVQTGQLSEIAGEGRILALERSRLEALRKIAAEFIQFAEQTGDPEKIRAATEFSQQLVSLGVDLNDSEHALARFRDAASQAVESDLADFLADGIDQAHGFADAFRALAASIVDSIRRIAAEILAHQILQSIFRAGPGGGIPVQGRAAGGLVTGPGTGVSDSIPARLSAGEFVVRAAVVQRPGILAHLSALNAGMVEARGLASRRGFAAGGLVTAGAGAGGRDARLLIGLDQGLVLRELESPAGQKLIVRSVARNKGALGSVLS